MSLNKTRIDWTDFSWNPVTGCHHGCDYCYARALVKRFRLPRWHSFKPPLHCELLDEPARIKRSLRMFVCSMGELFGPWVPQVWIDAVLETVRICSQHTFLFLTKSPERLPSLNPWPDNAWVGATATNQAQADRAIQALSLVEAPVRFLSAEPLLEEIRLHTTPFEWLIVGSCTGRKPIQPEHEWVLKLTEQAREGGCAVFYKANLAWENPPRELPSARERRHGNLPHPVQ